METDILFFKSWIITAFVFYLISILTYFLGQKRMGKMFIVAGLVANIVALIGRGYIEGTWYPNLMVAELFILPAVMALIVVFLFGRGRIAEGRVALIPFAVCCVITILIPVEAPLPWVKYQTISAALFFFTEALSFALLLVAGILAFACLVSNPSVEESYSRMILWGFVAFTLCQISGAIWAYLGWSYPFSWSTRHLASASLWCLYAAFIHAHFTGVHPRLKAACAAFGIIPFVYMMYHHQIISLLKLISERST